MGVPGALGKQAHRRTRSGSAVPRASESTERTRLSNVARLSVAHTTVEALRENVLVLGIILLIRTFLSLSLQLEVEGKLPWRREVAR